MREQIGTAANPASLTPRNRDTGEYSFHRMPYMPMDDVFLRIQKDHGSFIANLWSIIGFRVRAQQGRHPHFGYCRLSERGLAELMHMSRAGVQRRLVEAQEAGLVHLWHHPGQQTIAALGRSPRCVFGARGPRVLKGPSRYIPKDAYDFDFRPANGNLIRLHPISGDWCAISPEGKVGPNNGGEVKIPDIEILNLGRKHG